MVVVVVVGSKIGFVNENTTTTIQIRTLLQAGGAGKMENPLRLFMYLCPGKVALGVGVEKSATKQSNRKRERERVRTRGIEREIERGKTTAASCTAVC